MEHNTMREQIENWARLIRESEETNESLNRFEKELSEAMKKLEGEGGNGEIFDTPKKLLKLISGFKDDALILVMTERNEWYEKYPGSELPYSKEIVSGTETEDNGGRSIYFGFNKHYENSPKEFTIGNLKEVLEYDVKSGNEGLDVNAVVVSPYVSLGHVVGAVEFKADKTYVLFKCEKSGQKLV